MLLFFTMGERRARRVSSSYVVGLAFGIGLACGGGGGIQTDNNDNDFRPDVIYCEEALARLQSCCSSFDPTRILCRYHDDSSSGCGTTTFDRESPSLNEDESRCVLDTDCPTLIQDKVCDRAQKAPPYASSGTTTTCYADTEGCSSGRSGGGGGGTGGSGGIYAYPCTTGTSSSHAPVCP